MKKVLSMIGIAGILCVYTACKKDKIEPEPQVAAKAPEADTASLYVMIDSKPCTTPQKEYTSASLDIRGIKVYNTTTGWEELTPVQGAWDLVSLQTATVPVAEITEVTRVHAGAITKMTLTFGTNNKLGVNNQAMSCYNIGAKDVTLDFTGEVKANALNEIVVSVDICGHITVTPRYQDDPCYTLNPVMAFQSMVQR